MKSNPSKLLSKLSSSRRRFLATTMGAMAASAFAPNVLSRVVHAADGQSDRRFIFVYFDGGWDILMGLDPRDPEEFSNERLGDTYIEPGYEALVAAGARPAPDPFPVRAGNIWLGPSAAPLARVIDKVCVVRGINMDTLAHEAGRRRFITGRAPSGIMARGNSFATDLTSFYGAEESIPNLSFRVESYNRSRPPFASAMRVTSATDLVKALRPSASIPEEEELINAFLAADADCPAHLRSDARQAAEEARERARNIVELRLDKSFDLGNTGDAEIRALRERYGVGSDLGAPAAQAAVAANALMKGISRCVSIQAATGLDTHFSEWASAQWSRQLAGFEVVATLIEHLQSQPFPGAGGGSWLDHTTIVGFSEFSRTALRNANGGRDHSLTNACFVAGAGVRGNQAIGKSSDVGMGPTRANLQTGASDASGIDLRPEHVLAGILHNVGAAGDPADLRVDPLRAAFFDPA